MMPGGEAEAYAYLQPIVEKVAAQTDDGPCVMYIGKGGAGTHCAAVLRCCCCCCVLLNLAPSMLPFLPLRVPFVPAPSIMFPRTHVYAHPAITW